MLFEPGKEILIPSATDDVVEILTRVRDEERREIGEAMRIRVLAEHTAARRAEELEGYLEVRMDSAKVRQYESARVAR